MPLSRPAPCVRATLVIAPWSGPVVILLVCTLASTLLGCGGSGSMVCTPNAGLVTQGPEYAPIKCECPGGTLVQQRCNEAGTGAAPCPCCTEGPTRKCSCGDSSFEGSQSCVEGQQGYGECVCPECRSGETEECACPDPSAVQRRTCSSGRWGSCDCRICQSGSTEACGTCSGGQLSAGGRTCRADGTAWVDTCECFTPVCNNPGEARSCDCGGGRSGVSTCSADRRSWSGCDCRFGCNEVPPCLCPPYYFPPGQLVTDQRCRSGLGAFGYCEGGPICVYINGIPYGTATTQCTCQ